MRIVTGQRPDGTSHFVRTEEVAADFRSDSMPQSRRQVDIYRIWANDRLPVELPFTTGAAPLESEPTDGETPEALRKSSPLPVTPDGLRVSLLKFYPGAHHDLHWHDTFDVQWLIAGELSYRLDGGEEINLEPGDAVIQHGANHAWRAGPEGAILAVVRLGAKRVGITGPAAQKREPRAESFEKGEDIR
jgi:quercetin dioxygenase-like cupin family protein